MINHVLPRMACVCVILVFALAHCGCQSVGSSNWGTAWKTKPAKPSNPNDKEIVKYYGQKSPKKSDPPNMEELQSRIDREGEKNSRSKLFAEQMRLAKQYLKEKRLDDAKRAYTNALAVRPNDPDCHHGLAVIADDQNDFDAAEKHYEAALKQRPRDVNLLSDYGFSNFLRGNDQKAERVLSDALAASPKHKGALANLGAIYKKQGRQDDALAMFRRTGASEPEVQQHMAQLFPLSTPLGGGSNEIALAQNTNFADSRSGMIDDRTDLKGLPPEQLKEKLRRAKEEGIRQRQAQLEAESRVNHEWANDPPQMPPSKAGQNSGSGPWVLGRNGNQNPTPSGQVSPVGGMSDGANFSNTNPQYAANANNQYGSNQYGSNPYSSGQGYGQNGTGMTSNSGMTSNGGLTAPPGNSPNIDFWPGASVPNANQQPQNSTAQGNMMAQQGAGNGWNQQLQSGIDASPGTQINRYSFPQQPGVGSDPGGRYSSNASMAAAQLGMNLGPGGMFPVVTEEVSQTGFTPSTPAGAESRFGHEFPSPPQYQSPQYQNPNQQQSRGSFNSTDQRQQGMQQGMPQNQGGPMLAPPPVSDDWGPTGVPGGTSNGFVTPLGAVNTDGYRGGNGMMNMRESGQTSDNSVMQAGGAIPFNGPWPSSGGGQPFQSSQNGNATSNYPPQWNRGGNGSQPKVIGPAGSSAAGGSGRMPEQWPYGPRQ